MSKRCETLHSIEREESRGTNLTEKVWWDNVEMLHWRLEYVGPRFETFLGGSWWRPPEWLGWSVATLFGGMARWGWW